MNLSISNICWPKEFDLRFVHLIKAGGINAIDLAPTTIFPEWVIDSEKLRGVVRDLKSLGVKVPAFQSLFYKKPLSFFNLENLDETIAHFEVLIELGKSLGIHALVLGSPSARMLGSLKYDEAEKMFTNFLSVITPKLEDANINLCIEPGYFSSSEVFLPTHDSVCHFLRRSSLQRVKINLDTAILTAEGYNIGQVRNFIESNIDIVGHVHISRGSLKPMNSLDNVDLAVLGTLRSYGYDFYCSIEMTTDASSDFETEILNAIKCLHAFI